MAQDKKEHGDVADASKKAGPDATMDSMTARRERLSQRKAKELFDHDEFMESARSKVSYIPYLLELCDDISEKEDTHR